MTELELKTLCPAAQPEIPTIWRSQLTGKPRTLLYGYTCDRYTWHVYLANNTIVKLVYTGTWPTVKLLQWAEETSFEIPLLLPNKRLYPEACDREICALIAQSGFRLPFTTFNSKRPSLDFHGHLLTDFDTVSGELRDPDLSKR